MVGQAAKPNHTSRCIAQLPLRPGLQLSSALLPRPLISSEFLQGSRGLGYRGLTSQLHRNPRLKQVFWQEEITEVRTTTFLEASNLAAVKCSDLSRFLSTVLLASQAEASKVVLCPQGLHSWLGDEVAIFVRCIGFGVSLKFYFILFCLVVLETGSCCAVLVGLELTM